MIILIIVHITVNIFLHFEFFSTEQCVDYDSTSMAADLEKIDALEDILLYKLYDGYNFSAKIQSLWVDIPLRRHNETWHGHYLKKEREISVAECAHTQLPQHGNEYKKVVSDDTFLSKWAKMAQYSDRSDNFKNSWHTINFYDDISEIRRNPIKPTTQDIVLVHGYGATSALAWRNVLPKLCKEYNVYAIDLPAFGRCAVTVNNNLVKKAFPFSSKILFLSFLL